MSRPASPPSPSNAFLHALAAPVGAERPSASQNAGFRHRSTYAERATAACLAVGLLAMVAVTAIAAGAVDWTRQTTATNFGAVAAIARHLARTGLRPRLDLRRPFPRARHISCSTCSHVSGRRGVRLVGRAPTVAGAHRARRRAVRQRRHHLVRRAPALAVLAITAIWPPLTCAGPGVRRSEHLLVRARPGHLRDRFDESFIAPTEVRRSTSPTRSRTGSALGWDPFVLYLLGVPT